jgi:hypothetical protein
MVKKAPPLDDDRRRALALLAGSPRGVTQALMLANGFAAELLAELVLAGLATVVNEMVRAGGPTIKVETLRITDAGQRAIAG